MNSNLPTSRSFASALMAVAMVVILAIPMSALPGGKKGNGNKELDGDNPSQISGIIGSMGGGTGNQTGGKNKGGGSGGSGGGGNGSGG